MASGSLTSVLGVIVALVLLGGFATYRIQAMNAVDTGASYAPARTYRLYEGTPAAAYPEGAAGILLPAVTPLGSWSAAAVRKALLQVKNALVASHLDRETLVDHNAVTFLAMLTEPSREFQQRMFRSHEATPAIFVAKDVKLADVAPRVSGRLTVSASAGYLVVRSNYVWAYAFSGVSNSPGDHVVVVHDEIEWRAYGDDAEDPGLSVAGIRSYVYNISCADIKAGVIAPNRSVVDDGADDGVDWSRQAYDPKQSVEVPDKCPSPSPSG
ncbi:hypothetical protein [Fodinicola acaciae]|uniref:hypothetical protein n=1 Tax=Fodinicola acaciae TaxID=2681555 RepID=UPI0013CF7753|nr:hypothetical protein [Fodinicola acaciae]